MKLSIGTIMLVSLLLTTHSFATDRPYFSNNIITIPSLDVRAEQGVYQDIQFGRSERGSWRLLSLKKGTKIQEITNVELIQTDSFPVQVFVRISGIFNNGCQKIGQIATKVTDNRIDVSVFYDNASLEDGQFCAMVMVPFSKTISLPVYGLSAGVYEYTVNYNFSGTFELDKDNYFIDRVGIGRIGLTQ